MMINDLISCLLLDCISIKASMQFFDFLSFATDKFDL